MEFSIRRSGNTFICSGESCRGFVETESIAIRNWESMVRADQHTYSGSKPHLPKRVLQREDGADSKDIALHSIVTRKREQFSQKEDSSRTTEEVATAAAV